jgi:hypothetical protein
VLLVVAVIIADQVNVRTSCSTDRRARLGGAVEASLNASKREASRPIAPSQGASQTSHDVVQDGHLGCWDQYREG